MAEAQELKTENKFSAPTVANLAKIKRVSSDCQTNTQFPVAESNYSEEEEEYSVVITMAVTNSC